MIQDIAPMQLDNSYKKKVPHAGSRMFGFGERTVYLEYNGELQFLTYEQWKDYNENILGREVPSCIYLFSIGEEEYFLTEIGADTKIGEFRFYKMFDVRPMQPKERVLAAATAWHLFVWYRDNQFCGRCGKNWFTAKYRGCCSVRAARTWCFRRLHRQSLWESRTAIKSS